MYSNADPAGNGADPILPLQQHTKFTTSQCSAICPNPSPDVWENAAVILMPATGSHWSGAGGWS